MKGPHMATVEFQTPKGFQNRAARRKSGATRVQALRRLRKVAEARGLWNDEFKAQLQLALDGKIDWDEFVERLK